mgnify:CR=1 FL=1
MEFTDYMIWKLVAVGVAAFVYEWWQARNGR